MVNYYEVLDVCEKANTEEIKQSFRNLVKKYHPDRNSENKEWAETKVKLVLEAYRTLTNSTLRMSHDKLLQHHFSQQQHACFKGDFHKEQFDNSFRAKTILYDLVNRNVKKALDNYDRLKNDCTEADPLVCMTLNEYIDCKFLLAEEFERQGKYQKAIEYYEQAYSKKEVTTRHYLFEEIRDRIRNIYCHQLARSSTPHEAINYYKRVLELSQSKHETAFLYKKIAECYLNMNDYDSASEFLNLALALKPRLKGIQRISKKLKQHIIAQL